MPSKKELLNPITSQILDRCKKINVTLADTIEGKIAAIQLKEVNLAESVAELGFHYIDLQNSIDAGQFSEVLKRLGVSRSRVYRYMDIARFFLEMPESVVPALGQLQPSQISELTRLPEQAKQSLTSEDIQSYSVLSYRKLGALVKQINLDFDDAHKLESQNANLKHQLNEAQQQAAEAINELNHERIKKAPESLFGLPPLVVFAKQRAPELSQQVAEAGLDIVNLVERLLLPTTDQDQARQAAKAIYHFARGPALQLLGALQTLVNTYGEDTFADTSPLPVYEEHEWQIAEDKRKAVIDIHLSRFHPKTPKKRGRN